MFGSCLGVVPLCMCKSMCVRAGGKKKWGKKNNHTQQHPLQGGFCVCAKVSWVSTGAVSKRSALFPEPLLRRKHVVIAHPLRFLTPLVPYFEKYTPGRVTLFLSKWKLLIKTV